MSNFRRVALVVVVVVMGIGVFHAFRSYTWTGQERTPKGTAAQYADYTCGPPWGASYIHAPSGLRYAVAGSPCGQRQQYRVMVAVDLVLGAGAIVFLVGWHRRLRPSLA